jgi:hypothetical protein
MLVAAALCPAPPLLARELTGADPVVPELRLACLDAARGLLDSQPELVVVTGAGPRTMECDLAARLDLAEFAPGLRQPGAGRPPGQPRPGGPPGQPGADRPPGLPGPATPSGLPAAVGLGVLLLDQAGYAGLRVLQSVGQDAPAAECAALGERLAALRPRVALLVMADGSARRTLKAPGYLDERAVPFDDDVTRMLTGPDLSPLLGLDTELAGELMATGRAGWQVLAGAAAGLRAATEIRYRDDPFGVYYLVASIALAAKPAVALRPAGQEPITRAV